jgi:membrane associated rhomboid family serine protease
MIPLGDADRRPLRFPLVTIAIIAANVLMFLVELAGGVAYMAHIGGFVFGLILGRLFESHRRRKEQGLDGAK